MKGGCFGGPMKGVPPEGFGPMKGAPMPHPGPYAMPSKGCPGGKPGKGLPPGAPGMVPGGGAQMNELGLPIRPGAEQCLLFVNTGTCTNGAACIFDHPAGISKGKGGGPPGLGGSPPGLGGFGMMRPPPTPDNGTGPGGSGGGLPGITDPGSKPDESKPAEDSEKKDGEETTDAKQDAPAAEKPPPEEIIYNEEGLPVRPGVQMCGYFLRNGNCTFGPTCRFNHPSGLGGLMAGGGGIGTFNPLMVGGVKILEGNMPRRPGKEECTFLLRTGKCPFGPECRFDHSTQGQGAASAVAGDGGSSGMARIKPGDSAPKKKEVGLGGTRGKRPPPRQQGRS